MKALEQSAGSVATDEILAVLGRRAQAAEEAIAAMRDSSVTIKLPEATAVAAPRARELPWQRGARLARWLRGEWAVSAGPLSRDRLAELLDVALPLQRPSYPMRKVLRGGLRNGRNGERTAVLVTSAVETSQRFYLARLIGTALVSPPVERVLPVSDASTALQKFERSFAQEFLCPWEDLEAYLRQHGESDDDLADAAGHFGVSELVVRTALVNKGQLARDRLPA